MNLVIDANILFSTLIKDSKTAELIINPLFNLYAPELFFEEFYSYYHLIIKKTHRVKNNIQNIVIELMNIIKVIPNEKTEAFMNKTRAITPDPEDADYFALALKLNCPIWSNDKFLKSQNKIKVYSTEDLIKLLNL